MSLFMGLTATMGLIVPDILQVSSDFVLLRQRMIEQGLCGIKHRKAWEVINKVTKRMGDAAG